MHTMYYIEIVSVSSYSPAENTVVMMQSVHRMLLHT